MRNTHICWEISRETRRISRANDNFNEEICVIMKQNTNENSILLKNNACKTQFDNNNEHFNENMKQNKLDNEIRIAKNEARLRYKH